MSQNGHTPVTAETRRPAGNRGAGGNPRRLIDGTMVFFIVLALVSASLVAITKGTDAVWRAATATAWLVLAIAAPIAVGMLLGGLVREIVDPKQVSAALGASSGWRGLVLASALGALMPGGPFVAFPVVYALFLAGADVGAVIAFLTSWSLIALQRVIVWELPLLGIEFVAVRVLVSLPLPILAGLLARWLAVGPLAIERPTETLHDNTVVGSAENGQPR